MELRHLKYFIAVAEEENVTRAAARLHVAQPSLSRQIRDLEDELEVPLFDRAARSVRLTDAGRHFLGKAKEAVAAFDEAARSVREFANGRETEIHIGYAPSLTTEVLPRTLLAFQKNHPRMRVKLHDLSTGGMLAGLRDGSLQAALLVKPSATALEGLEYAEILRFRPWVAMAHAHPLAGEETVATARLKDQPLLAYAREDYPEHHAWMEKIFKGARSPKLFAEYDSSTSLIAAIESGCGIAIVQEGFESLAGVRIALRPLAAAGSTAFPLGVACRKDDRTEATRAFVAEAKRAGVTG